MKIIVIGCGRMGSGLARTLALRGHAITVVDQAEQAFTLLGPTFKGERLVGIGFDRDTLQLAGVERADGLAAVTNSDEANIVAARVAREIYRVPKVVARVVDPQKAEIYRRLGLQTISTTAWGIGRMANLLSYAEFDVVLDLDSQVEVVVAEVPPALAGYAVAQLVVPGEIQVVAIGRGGHTFLPTVGTHLHAGDLVHFALVAGAADQLKRLLNHS